MRRRNDDGIDVRASEAIDVHAEIIDGDTDDAESGRADHRTRFGVAGVLDRDPSNARAREDACDQREALREAGADQDAPGIRGGAADPVEVGGERFAQLHDAAPIQIAEALARRFVQHPP